MDFFFLLPPFRLFLAAANASTVFEENVMASRHSIAIRKEFIVIVAAVGRKMLPLVVVSVAFVVVVVAVVEESLMALVTRLKRYASVLLSPDFYCEG